MDRQTKVPPPALGRKDLLLVADSLRSAVDAMEVVGIPEALGHLDLNPGNIIVSQNRCAFLDWAEACVAHPFFSLEYLLEHFRRAIGPPPPVEKELVASYAREWGAVLPEASVVSTLTRAPLLAAFAYAFGSNFWNDRCRYRTASTAGYLRALTRRMSREANRLTDRMSQCPI